MSLLTKIKADHIEARKARNAAKVSILTLIIGEATRSVKEPSDEEVLKTIRKIEMSLKDMITFIGENDADTAKADLAVVQSYLPTELDQPQLIAAIIALGDIAVEMKNMKVIKAELEKTYPGSINGQLLANIVKTWTTP